MNQTENKRHICLFCNEASGHLFILNYVYDLSATATLRIGHSALGTLLVCYISSSIFEVIFISLWWWLKKDDLKSMFPSHRRCLPQGLVSNRGLFSFFPPFPLVKEYQLKPDSPEVNLNMLHLPPVFTSFCLLRRACGAVKQKHIMSYKGSSDEGLRLPCHLGLAKGSDAGT